MRSIHLSSTMPGNYILRKEDILLRYFYLNIASSHYKTSKNIVWFDLFLSIVNIITSGFFFNLGKILFIYLFIYSAANATLQFHARRTKVEMPYKKTTTGLLILKSILDLKDAFGGSSAAKTRSLDWNEECAFVERNWRLALALQIKNPNPRLGAPVHLYVLKFWAKKDTRFALIVHDLPTDYGAGPVGGSVGGQNVEA